LHAHTTPLHLPRTHLTLWLYVYLRHVLAAGLHFVCHRSLRLDTTRSLLLCAFTVPSLITRMVRAFWFSPRCTCVRARVLLRAAFCAPLVHAHARLFSFSAALFHHSHYTAHRSHVHVHSSPFGLPFARIRLRHAYLVGSLAKHCGSSLTLRTYASLFSGYTFFIHDHAPLHGCTAAPFSFAISNMFSAGSTYCVIFYWFCLILVHAHAVRFAFVPGSARWFTLALTAFALALGLRRLCMRYALFFTLHFLVTHTLTAHSVILRLIFYFAHFHARLRLFLLLVLVARVPRLDAPFTTPRLVLVQYTLHFTPTHTHIAVRLPRLRSFTFSFTFPAVLHTGLGCLGYTVPHGYAPAFARLVLSLRLHCSGSVYHTLSFHLHTKPLHITFGFVYTFTSRFYTARFPGCGCLWLYAFSGFGWFRLGSRFGSAILPFSCTSHVPVVAYFAARTTHTTHTPAAVYTPPHAHHAHLHAHTAHYAFCAVLRLGPHGSVIWFIPFAFFRGSRLVWFVLSRLRLHLHLTQFVHYSPTPRTTTHCTTHAHCCRLVCGSFSVQFIFFWLRFVLPGFTRPLKFAPLTCAYSPLRLRASSAALRFTGLRYTHARAHRARTSRTTHWVQRSSLCLVAPASLHCAACYMRTTHVCAPPRTPGSRLRFAVRTTRVCVTRSVHSFWFCTFPRCWFFRTRTRLTLVYFAHSTMPLTFSRYTHAAAHAHLTRTCCGCGSRSFGLRLRLRFFITSTHTRLVPHTSFRLRLVRFHACHSHIVWLVLAHTVSFHAFCSSRLHHTFPFTFTFTCSFTCGLHTFALRLHFVRSVGLRTHVSFCVYTHAVSLFTRLVGYVRLRLDFRLLFTFVYHRLRSFAFTHFTPLAVLHCTTTLHIFTHHVRSVCCGCCLSGYVYVCGSFLAFAFVQNSSTFGLRSRAVCFRFAHHFHLRFGCTAHHPPRRTPVVRCLVWFMRARFTVSGLVAVYRGSVCVCLRFGSRFMVWTHSCTHAHLPAARTAHCALRTPHYCTAHAFRTHTTAMHINASFSTLLPLHLVVAQRTTPRVCLRFTVAHTSPRWLHTAGHTTRSVAFTPHHGLPVTYTRTRTASHFTLLPVLWLLPHTHILFVTHSPFGCLPPRIGWVFQLRLWFGFGFRSVGLVCLLHHLCTPFCVCVVSRRFTSLVLITLRSYFVCNISLVLGLFWFMHFGLFASSLHVYRRSLHSRFTYCVRSRTTLHAHILPHTTWFAYILWLCLSFGPPSWFSLFAVRLHLFWFASRYALFWFPLCRLIAAFPLPTFAFALRYVCVVVPFYAHFSTPFTFTFTVYLRLVGCVYVTFPVVRLVVWLFPFIFTFFFFWFVRLFLSFVRFPFFPFSFVAYVLSVTPHLRLVISISHTRYTGWRLHVCYVAFPRSRYGCGSFLTHLRFVCCRLQFGYVFTRYGFVVCIYSSFSRLVAFLHGIAVVWFTFGLFAAPFTPAFIVWFTGSRLLAHVTRSVPAPRTVAFTSPRALGCPFVFALRTRTVRCSSAVFVWFCVRCSFCHTPHTRFTLFVRSLLALRLHYTHCTHHTPLRFTFTFACYFLYILHYFVPGYFVQLRCCYSFDWFTIHLLVTFSHGYGSFTVCGFCV